MKAIIGCFTFGGKFSSVHKANKHFGFGKSRDIAESAYFRYKLSVFYNFFVFHMVVGLLAHNIVYVLTTLVIICFSCVRGSVCYRRQDSKLSVT